MRIYKMQHKLLILLVFIASYGFFDSSVMAQINDSSVDDVPVHIRYFGFYATSVSGWWMVGDGQGGNLETRWVNTFLPEVVDHTNVTFTGGDIDQLSFHFDQAMETGHHVVLNLAPFFYDKVPVQGQGDIQILRILKSEEELRRTFPILREFLDDYLGQGLKLLSFYLDEPYMHSLEPQQVVADELDLIAEIVGQAYPDIFISTTFAHIHVHDQLVLPKKFDRFAFDCYRGFDRCGRQGQSVPEFFALLKEKVLSLNADDGGTRRMYLVPPSAISSQYSFPDENVSPEELVIIIDKYVALARSEPIIELVMPFIWQSYGDEFVQWIGTREMPIVRERYRQIGEFIISGTPF